MYSKKRLLYICEDCGNEFTVEHKPTSRRIYLSYGIDEHSALAMRIKRDLEARGHEVWYDPDCAREGAEREKFVEAGMDWVSEIPGEGRFLVVLTPSAVRRPDGYCLGELALAVQRKLALIPVMASFCEPPLSICRIQWLDMMDCHPLGENEEMYLNKLEALVTAIEEDVTDFKGAQSRLLHVLEPLPFDADIQRHLARFVGRQWIFGQVDAWLADPAASRVFWIVGPPGVGKTAIASWLAFNREEVGAFHLCRHGDVLKADPRRAVMSIAYQLSTQLPDYRDRLNAVNLEKITREGNAKALFDALIVQPLSGDFPDPGRVIAVLIDALDEATQGSRNELADLIASDFDRAPGWLRLIITSRPDPEVLRPLQGLTPYQLDTTSQENDRDIRDFLARELKPYAEETSVMTDAVERIAAMSEGVFLYVEWIRQELAQKRLSLYRLDEFPRGLTGVYSQFFSRQYPALDAYRSRISPALEVVVSALEPLDLKTVADIFRWDDYAQADFCQEVGAMFPILDGKIQPFHRSITDWLTDAGKASAYYIDALNGHRRMADSGWAEYKGGVPAMSGYMKAHLPAHLIQVERWPEVTAMLTDLTYFEIASRLNEFSVRSYWSRIEERAGVQIVDAYKPILAEPAKYGDKSSGVAHLLFNTSHFGEAGVLYEHLIGHYRGHDDLWSLKESLEKMGLILSYKNEIDGALKMLKEEEQLCRQLGDYFGLYDCLAHQAVPLYSKGDWESINKVVQEMESKSSRVNKRGLTRVLHMKGLMLFEMGNLEEAVKIFIEKEKVCREIKDVECLIWTLNMKAATLYEKGDLQHSLSVSREMEKICRDHGHKLALRFALINLGDINYDIGNVEEAIGQLTQAKDLSSSLGIKKDIEVCLNHLSIIYSEIGNMDEALKTYEEELAICKEQNDMPSYNITLGNISLVYFDKGRLAEAMGILREKERFMRELAVKKSVQIALGNQALILFDQDDLEGAMRLHREEEAICREIAKGKDLGICRYNQANVLLARGDAAGAMKMLDELEQEFRKENYLAGVVGCMSGRATIQSDAGRREEALRLLGEAVDICHKTGMKKKLMACLGNQAVILHGRGDVKGAVRLFEEAGQIARTIDFKEGLATSLMDQAIVEAFECNRLEVAIGMAREAREIADRCGMTRMARQMIPLLEAIEHKATLRAAAAADGGKEKVPDLIRWTIKMPKLEKK
jgi:tetratricopeptide (TPR) repeat protein